MPLIKSMLVLDTAVGGNGWGAGGFSGINADLSTFGWGEAADSGTTANVRLWSHDNFGEDLLINPRDGGIFYWDKSDGSELKSRGSFFCSWCL